MPESRRYSYYVLAVLTLAYVFNYLDRYVLSVLLPAIKLDLSLSDSMLGFLVGPAFAVVYAFAGIPVARMADTRSRTGVISIGMVLWSLFTAASGLVQTAFQLACARIAVGVGEAAGTAPSHSLISDYFEPERRGQALAIFSVGVYGGMFLGMSLGGYFVETIGWRWTFAAVGLPGIAVALLLKTTVREPARPARTLPTDASAGVALAGGSPDESTWDGMRLLWSQRSFRQVVVGLGAASFGGAGFGIWAPTFLNRVHEMPMSKVGLFFGTISPLSTIVAAIAGGFLCDRLIRRDRRWWVWLPLLSTGVSTPLLVAVLLWPNGDQAVWWALPAGIGGMASPAIYAVVQGLAPVRLRALASSVMVLNVTLIGMGAGPWAVGVLSEVLSDRFGAESIRFALLIGLVGNPIGMFLYWRAGRTLIADLDKLTGAESGAV